MSSTRLVHPTGRGRLCPECARPAIECRCRRSEPAQTPEALAKGDGTAHDGVIVIQGDHRDVLVAEPAKLGYVARRSGG